MRYAFVIDQNRCIGCHACSVACKEEHDIPLGANRTWVKYIERGVFPSTRRHFAVLRCNHCDNAPCVTICPTIALYRRPDGIIDFDNARCIGCKACMQACPYDALYIEPATRTAAKCNFCAHRVEEGVQPACEVVCPTQAILSGDLDAPQSRVSAIVATRKVTVRKAQKGTDPKLFYVGADEDVLEPARVETRPSYVWSGKYPGEDKYALDFDDGRRAVETLDVAHPRVWGRKIAAYLWTKSIAAGMVIVAAILMALGLGESLLRVTSAAVALVFTAATTILLVVDLKRPDRFHYLLLKPNPKSWLVLGGYLLVAYSLLCVSWLVLVQRTGAIPAALVGVSAIVAVAVAGYSAFLFAQAKGRDLWQSPLFLWHLIVQAVIAGAAATILLGMATGASPNLLRTSGAVLAASLIVNQAMILTEVSLPASGENVRRATDLLIRGGYGRWFWAFVVGLGGLLPVVILFGARMTGEPSNVTYASASVAALCGLWAFEELWIKAGQRVPLS